MATYPARKIVWLPAAQAKAVNTRLEKFGLGPANFGVPLIGKNDPGTAPTTHLGCDIACNRRIARVLQKALAAIPQAVSVEVSHLDQAAVDKALDQRGLKRKIAAAATIIDLEP